MIFIGLQLLPALTRVFITREIPKIRFDILWGTVMTVKMQIGPVPILALV